MTLNKSGLPELELMGDGNLPFNMYKLKTICVFWWGLCSTETQKYCTVHCTGYMRSWPSSHLGVAGEGDADKESSHFSCLVAMGRVHCHAAPQANGEVQVKPTEFITRYAMDGKFTFVDQRYCDCMFYYVL